MVKVKLQTLQQVSTGSRKYKDACDWLKMLWDMPPADTPPFTPCSNPCSIMRRDLAYIHMNPYKAGLKTDGVRFFLLAAWMDCGADTESLRYAVLIDRACRMFEVQLPDSVDPDVYSGTLVDGELIADDDDEGNQFVAFDLVAYKGYDYKDQLHSKRIQSLNTLFQTIPSLEPGITVHVKRWMQVAEAVAMLRDQPHVGVDGLILVHEHKRIVNGTDRFLFKWKPTTEHTVDLKHDHGRLYVHTQRGDVCAFESLRIRLRPQTTALPHDTIIEFQVRLDNREEIEQSQQGQQGQQGQQQESPHWLATPVFVREDKTKANHLTTVRLTLQNILESIQLHELVA